MVSLAVHFKPSVFSTRQIVSVRLTTRENPAVTTTARPVELLPTASPRRLIGADGARAAAAEAGGAELPADEVLVELHRRMVLCRRLDAQATALTKQGRLAVYPSAHGQDASQVASVAALADRDWLFPTYRDSMALFSRGIDPVEVLTLLRGDWHCGYDPYLHRTAPQCTPLATNTVHAVGLARAAQLAGQDLVALVMLGDGATSEGDTHEALNIAAVWQAPVVFFVQNNGYAISVPLSKQTHAQSFAHKGIGYGMPGMLVDGNDAAVVYAGVSEAVVRARAGHGPTLIEAVTYRIEAHTNADDAGRYRTAAEVAAWLERDPIERLQTYLHDRGLLDQVALESLHDVAEAQAAQLRQRMNTDPQLRTADLFEHVYATPTRSLRAQAAALAEELTGV
jgi:2-oxoisovalerate dehydrogenase E1 component alpha subunit